MKKFFRFALIIAALFAGFSSCVKEPMEPASSDDLPYPEDGKAVIEVSAVLPSEIRTKAMGDTPSGITSMRVAVFGSSGFLKETVDVDVHDGYFESATTNGDLYKFKVKLTLTDSKRLRIHVIANFPSEKTFPWKGEDEVMRRYAFTEGTQDAYWCRFVLDGGLELKKEMVLDPITGQYNVEYLKDGEYYQVTDAVTDAFSNLPLLRNFAKITVESTTPQLTLNPTTTMAIINKPLKGSVAPALPTGGFVENYYTQQYSDLRANYDGYSPFDTELVNTDPDTVPFLSCTVSGSTISGGDFMYERPRSTRTPSYLIIHGTYRGLKPGLKLSDWKSPSLAEDKRYPNDVDTWLVPSNEAVDGYYKIDFMDDEGYYAIFRNFRYHIRITGVSKPGAATAGAAGSTGGTGDISTSTEAAGITDISDGYGRIAVSYLERTLVDQHSMIELKYKFIPDVEAGDTPDNRLDSEGGPVTIAIEGATGPVNVFADAIDGSIPSGTDLGTAGTGGTGLIRVLPGNDAEGYRTIRFSTNAPSSVDRTSQKIRITGRIDENHPAIFREVKYYLMEKQNMIVTCEADVPNVEHEINAVESAIGEGVNVNIKIPILLPESMFPLVFKLESSELSITPNTTKYPTENLPVESGESLCTGQEGKKSFHYVRTLSYAEYNSLPDNNGKTITCHFKTNKAENASTVYVTNDYFNKGSAAFTNYTLFHFSNMAFSNYRAAANTNLNFTFNLDSRDNARPRVVKVTLDGLVPQNASAQGWSTVNAEDGVYSWTVSSGNTATLALRTITSGYNGQYSVTLEAVDGSTAKTIYHPAEIYNMDYLVADLAINNSNYTQNSITVSNVTFAFDNVSGAGNNNNRYKQFGSSYYYSGSVQITAPSAYSIVSIGITYTSNNYSNQAVSYNPPGDASDKNNWSGKSDKVTVTMAASGYNNYYNRVNRITVTLKLK